MSEKVKNSYYSGVIHFASSSTAERQRFLKHKFLKKWNIAFNMSTDWKLVTRIAEARRLVAKHDFVAIKKKRWFICS